MKNAGRVMPLPRGEYDGTVTYNLLDFVTYNGSSYICKKESMGNTPAENNEFWQILAQGGGTSVVIGDEAVEFTEAETRANIGSGEKLKTILGKLGKWYTDFKTVVFTGSYNDLFDKPQSLKNPNALTFTGAVTGNYDGSVAKSVAIPSVGNGTLTIQKNGANVQTFTANQSSNVTANITVPTNAADVGAVATSKVLTTKEQIEANTDATNVAGAVAVIDMVSQLSSELVGAPFPGVNYKASNIASINGYGKTYTATQDCAMIIKCGTANTSVPTNVSIDGVVVAASILASSSVTTYPCIFPPIYVKKGQTVATRNAAGQNYQIDFKPLIN